jgi:HAD superfamily hydrolase (TIGR01509 family)
MLRGVLLDVGGTLWPQHGPAISVSLRAERILSALPHLTPDAVHGLLEALAAAPEPPDGAPQDIYAYLRNVADTTHVDLATHELELLRKGLCIPGPMATTLFPHADTLLRDIRALGLRCAIVSNALVRNGADYAEDFAAFGLADCITAYVSSLDVKMRKPHPLPFQHALKLLACTSVEAVMVGDNEKNDIAPAQALGMRTIRVTIERRDPAETVADLTAANLKEVRDALAQWVAEFSR